MGLKIPWNRCHNTTRNWRKGCCYSKVSFIPNSWRVQKLCLPLVNYSLMWTISSYTETSCHEGMYLQSSWSICPRRPHSMVTYFCLPIVKCSLGWAAHPDSSSMPYLITKALHYKPIYKNMLSNESPFFLPHFLQKWHKTQELQAGKDIFRVMHILPGERNQPQKSKTVAGRRRTPCC